MDICVRCKQESTDLIKHSVYKDFQKYVCRPCNSERVALSRSLRKLRLYPKTTDSVPKNIETVATSVPIENKPVSAPLNDVPIKMGTINIEALQRGRDAIARVMAKYEKPAEIVTNAPSDIELVSEDYVTPEGW